MLTQLTSLVFHEYYMTTVTDRCNAQRQPYYSPTAQQQAAENARFDERAQLTPEVLSSLHHMTSLRSLSFQTHHNHLIGNDDALRLAGALTQLTYLEFINCFGLYK